MQSKLEVPKPILCIDTAFSIFSLWYITHQVKDFHKTKLISFIFWSYLYFGKFQI